MDVRRCSRMFTVFRFFTPFFVAVYTRVQAKSQHFSLVQSGDFLLAIKEIRVRQSEVLKLEDGRHQAAKGLFLEVRGNGRHRSWLFIYRRHGKRSAIGLGSAAKVSLQAAKDLAIQLESLLAQGQDPKSTVERARQQSDQPQSDEDRTCAKCFAEALKTMAEVKRWKNPRTYPALVANMEKYVYPYIGNKVISDITVDDILNVLKQIWYDKAPTAKRLRSVLEWTLDYAIKHNWRESPNPACWKSGLQFDLPQFCKIHTTKHRAALTLNELKTVLSDLLENPDIFKFSVVFGALTATRVNEFLGASWSEVDLENKVWSVPPERRKDKKQDPFRVPLCTQAILILQRLPSRSGLLFPGKRKGMTMNKSTPNECLKKFAKTPATMHGCRSTFRDWAAESGQDFILAEKSLMHNVGNEVVQAYQRSDQLEQRRILMQKWADVLLPEKLIH